MSAFLLSIVLLLQGIPLQPTQTGTISGILRGEDGKPAAAVRIAALPQLDTLQSDAAPTLSSIAETDAEGRFTLENVPPGRYYISAGRLDYPTFYPGTQSMALGQSVQVTPGAAVKNIQFTLNAASAGRSISSGATPLVLLEVPMNVSVEGGGKLPLFNGAQSVSLKLTGLAGPILVPISATTFNLYPPAVPLIATNLNSPVSDYTLSIEGLPAGYSVKSIKYGANGLPLGNRLSIGGFPVAGSRTLLSAPTLSIVLARASEPASRGHRVRGATTASTPRPLTLSGLPGIVFADGTFEFHNVPSGRHILMTQNNSPTLRPWVALIVVGDQDLDGVTLQTTPTAVLPRKTQTPGPSEGLTSRTPGVVPLASLHGRIVDAETGMPLRAGTIYLVGDGWATFELGTGGKFDFEHLLPGTYEMEVQGVGYPTFRREIVIDEKDIDVELKAS